MSAKNEQKNGGDLEAEGKIKSGTVRFSKRNITIPLKKNEKWKMFIQRKSTSVDTGIETNEYAKTLGENCSSEVAPMLSRSAEARTNVHTQIPQITIRTAKLQNETGSNTADHNQINDYKDDDHILQTKKHHVQKEFSLESSYAFSVDTRSQSNSTSILSSSPEVLEDTPKQMINRSQSFSDDSENDSNTNITNKQIKTKVLSISDSEECDTDLEIDPDFGKADEDQSDGNIGTDRYLKYCKRWKIVPQKVFLDGLSHRSLSLRNRSLGNSAIAPGCKALKDNLRVERLNLDSTDIKDSGCRHIAEMLLENICVSRLNLSNNDIGLLGSQLLGHVMTVTKYLTHLNLSGNKFDDNCAWFLADGISTNETLENLDMSYNNLEYVSGKLIGKALVINKRLKVLNLSWNKLCGKGSVSVFHALMFNQTLESLDISWNGIGYEGSVALSKCFKKNRSLKEIDVSNNRIDWLGAPLIAVGLKKNGVLKKLKIGQNPLTTTGCLDLLEAASAETNGLSLLDASEICVVGEADLLAATISRRRKFTFLHGRILPTHDKLGEKQGREINPMLRIIEYLRLLGLRPLELMKSFHKTASYELPRKEFIDEIKRIGVKLHPHEIEAVANSISAKGYDRNVINYRKLAVAVREVVEEERKRKIREREEWRQIKTYHEKILRRGTLNNVPIPRSGNREVRQKEKEFVTVNALYTPLSSTSSIKSSGRSKTAPISMCAPIDSTGSRSKQRSHTKRKVKLQKR